MPLDDLKSTLESLHGDAFGWAVICCRGNVCDAEEVLQTTYVKVLQGKARFRAKSNFKTWLFGVIRNTSREQARRQRAGRHVLMRLRSRQTRDTGSRHPSQHLESAEQAAAIRAMLEELSDRQREVLHLVFYQSLTLEQAAAVMDIAVGTARKHYERAKHRLREMIGQTSEPSRRPTLPCVV